MSQCESTEEHCWHPTGMAQMSNPPNYERVCCWCGHAEFVPEATPTDVNRHGEFHPGQGYPVRFAPVTE